MYKYVKALKIISHPSNPCSCIKTTWLYDLVLSPSPLLLALIEAMRASVSVHIECGQKTFSYS